MLIIDPNSPTPPYEQLKQQIITARDNGTYASNYRLPPVRHLALELGLSPGTVARAYKELEYTGIIETRGRHGTFILARRDGNDLGDGEAQPNTTPSPEAAAQIFTQAAANAGLTNSEALALIEEALSSNELSDNTPHS